MTLFNDRKDRVSAYLHLFGMVLSIAGLILLVAYAAKTASTWHVVTFSVYGASMVLLYAASSFYHLFYISDKFRDRMRKVDHMMIFVLIAGTYTPICLVPLRGPWGWTLFGIIWGCALAGILSKVFWMNAPRILYTLFYILMGWMAVIAFFPLMQTVPSGGITWLIAGGIFYSIGGICYALKWPPLKSSWFGFHELFHIFVLLGSFCHFIMMFFYVLDIR